ncbi:response regulator transcription factor [Paenibacillus athensensis]|uniref:LuxR family transcriptional regulator n=1 Tax=Paenibacillus athensensis TaxID=1967502 RepID=A0A4Y8Q331_9BACL|nr:response regulator transcription factor [Paenibacillus athensensis]MCD1259252.1 response regulator transcription factor [Paenibacillus athensensis]
MNAPMPPDSPVTAIVIDDHPLMAGATRQLLEQTGDIRVLATAVTGQAGLELIGQHRPELVVLDYQLPDLSGIQLAEQIRRIDAEVRIVLFTGHDLSALADIIVWELGISAVISKDTPEAIVQHMIPCVLHDQLVLPRPLLNRLRRPQRVSLYQTPLTDEDIHILQMVSRGVTHEAIADKIHTSRRTVDNHLRKIYEKLGVASKIQALQKVLGDEQYAAYFREENES